MRTREAPHLVALTAEDLAALTDEQLRQRLRDLSEALRAIIPRENWRSRWLQRAGHHGTKMHRVAVAVWDEPDEMIAADAVMVCGARRRFVMPGFLSRTGAARCPKCCKALGIPPGYGAPFNSDELWSDA